MMVKTKSGLCGKDGAVAYGRSGTWAHQTHTAAAAAESLQLRLTLCDPINSSPPGSPIPGILQARTLEWRAHKKKGRHDASFSTMDGPTDYHTK